MNTYIVAKGSMASDSPKKAVFFGFGAMSRVDQPRLMGVETHPRHRFFPGGFNTVDGRNPKQPPGMYGPCR